MGSSQRRLFNDKLFKRIAPFHKNVIVRVEKKELSLFLWENKSIAGRLVDLTFNVKLERSGYEHFY